jgi:hypothetical protein
MRRCEMKRLEARGFERKIHEKNLEPPPLKYEPLVGRLPVPLALNGYNVDFKKELIGGFQVDITDDKHQKVATGVKIKRWSWTDVRDPLTDNRIELSLSILYPHSLKMTVFERPR